MRYKKGTKVEVLDKTVVPSGSWWCAVVISGNGHTYSVRYDPSPSGVSELVRRVSRKMIRPCPPLIQGPISWISGDIVEAFDDGSWKLAEVSSAVDGNFFFVRLLGSSKVLKVHKTYLRLRQCWHDNGWVVIGKDVRNSDNGKVLKGRCRLRVISEQAGGFMKPQNCEETTTFEEHKQVSFVAKNRGLQNYPSQLEIGYRVSKKRKTGDAKNKYQQLNAESQYHLQEKVDAVASPQTMLGETYMHASLNNRTGFSELDVERGKPDGDVGCSVPRFLERNDASVCSSSGSNDLDMLYCYPFTAAILDGSYLSDDADSSYWSNLRETQSFQQRRSWQ